MEVCFTRIDYEYRMSRIDKTDYSIEDMLRGYVLNYPGSWDNYIPLMEFSYNNSY